MKLTSEVARNDLTDRECAKLIGATIGGIVEMASVEDVIRAVQWWAENQSYIRLMYGDKLPT